MKTSTWALLIGVGVTYWALKTKRIRVCYNGTCWGGIEGNAPTSTLWTCACGPSPQTGGST